MRLSFAIMPLILGSAAILAACSNGGENGGAATTGEEADAIESSPSEPGVSDDELASMYVNDLYGARVTSLEDASFFIAGFWFRVYDDQLKRIEEFGYNPFALRPGCTLASAFAFRDIRVRRASSFESLFAEETLLTEIVQLIEENADEVVEGNLPPDVDKGWCEEIEDEIRQEYNALPPP